MREYQLWATSSFFENNNKYNTWLVLPQLQTEKRKAYQLDQIFIPKNQLCQTTNVKRKFDGATSNHAALFIEFKLPNDPQLKKKQPRDSDNEKAPIKKIDNNTLHNKQIGAFQKKLTNTWRTQQILYFLYIKFWRPHNRNSLWSSSNRNEAPLRLVHWSRRDPSKLHWRTKWRL